MPTKGEPHENLVLFEDDLYRAFYYLVYKIMAWDGRKEGEEDDKDFSSTVVSSINGAKLMVEELLKKESNDDEV